jgi:hypothetical protein
MAEADKGSDPSPALAHAWAWFELHANQRMQTVNFFLILEGARVAGVAGTIKDPNYVLFLVLGVAMTLVAALFYGLDRRACSLVDIGEKALKSEEARLAAAAGDCINLIAASDHAKRNGLSYTNLFRVMFLAFAIAGLGLSGFSASRIASPRPAPAAAPMVDKDPPPRFNPR